VTSCDKQYRFEIASGTGDDKGDMISFGIDNAIEFRLDEGLAVFYSLKMSYESDDNILRRFLNHSDSTMLLLESLHLY